MVAIFKSRIQLHDVFMLELAVYPDLPLHLSNEERWTMVHRQWYMVFCTLQQIWLATYLMPIQSRKPQLSVEL